MLGKIRPLIDTHEWDAAGKRYAEALVFALLINGYLCLYHLDMPGVLLLLILSLVSATILLNRGFLWADSMAQAWKKWFARVVAMVIGLAFLGMVYFPWPINLAFFVSAPALERVADQVLEDGYIQRPQWAGLFYVFDSDQQDGNVALITNARYGGRLGLVRFSNERIPEVYAGPMFNLNWDHQLFGNWYFQAED